MLPAVSAVLLLALTWNQPVGTPGSLIQLTSVRRALPELSRRGAHDDLARLTTAVVGDGAAGIAERDALAYKLLSLGYTARETADIVSERISKDALDTARTLRMVGRSRDAAIYLENAYRRTAPVIEAMPAPARGLTLAPVALAHVTVPRAARKTLAKATPKATPTAFPTSTTRPAAMSAARPPTRASTRTPPAHPIEAAIAKYARLHAVDPTLIRAIIGAESGFEHSARSSAGAIGLMQLMPGTARDLGVDPRVLEQNVEGGVRYLSGLLKTFGGVELALVAYNAGPELARRYARGEVALYAETRDYVRQVLARMR